MCLFRPQWKSNDEEKARSAILKLRRGSKKTERIVRKIMDTDRRKPVIDAALSVSADDEYKKMIYETSDIDYIKATALSNIENDPEYVKAAIIDSKNPPPNAVLRTGGDKEFAYGLLSEKIKLKSAVQSSDFWFQVVDLVFRLADSTDNQRMLDVIMNSKKHIIIKESMCYFEMKHDKETLIKIAGEGCIHKLVLQSYPVNPRSPILYAPEEYRKKCARDILKKWGYASDAWLPSCMTGEKSKQVSAD